MKEAIVFVNDEDELQINISALEQYTRRTAPGLPWLEHKALRALADTILTVAAFELLN